MIDLSKKLSQSLKRFIANKKVVIVSNNMIPLIIGLINPIAGIIVNAIIMCY